MFGASRRSFPSAQSAHSDRLYIGFRSQEGNPVVCVGQGGKYRLLGSEVAYGCPDTEWGRVANMDWASERGSGPLAFALLMDATGGDKEKSLRLQDRFRREVVSQLPWEGFRLRLDFIYIWLEQFSGEPGTDSVD